MPPTRSRHLLYAASFALPAILLFSSIRTFLELDAQREVYLRERAATLAGRLEAAAARGPSLDLAILSLVEEEPHLQNLRLTDRPARPADNPPLDAVWRGLALFHTQFVDAGGLRLYRAYVPFHDAGVMKVAQIDIDAASSDFLVVHARHNVILAVAGGVALILLSLYSIWTARRTTALERSQLELQHLAHLGTMSAVLAHEIRNPLGTIKGFAQLALEQGGAAFQPLLVPVLQQTQRLESLVSDLLVYGRPPTPSFRLLHWPALAARLESTVRTLLAGRPILCTIDTPEIDLFSDPDLLEQILVNLIRNAIDAVEGCPNPSIILSVNATPTSVRLSVRDNGPGIPPPDRDKVLQPFFTTKAFGTGLGLPISARLAKVLRGSLEVQSTSPQGTVLTVNLPPGEGSWNKS